MDIKKVLLSAATVTGMMAAGTVAANADTVTVKAGDTVSALAQEYSTTVAQIQQDNKLNNVDLIVVGQQLDINGTNTSSSTATATANTANTTANSNPTPAKTVNTPKVAVSSSQTTSGVTSASESAAKAWIAARESGNSYTAKNGNYYGKYQLAASYLHGDYSAANQERVADHYVTSRYGSWQGAVNHWKAYGWY